MNVFLRNEKKQYLIDQPYVNRARKNLKTIKIVDEQ